jgi:hypothetical protein
VATKTPDKGPAARLRAGDIDLTDLNREAADAATAAVTADAANPPGLKPVTTADVPTS